MKTWIIVLAITFVVLRLIREGLKNYITNDQTERARYYFLHGATTMGGIYAIFYILSKLILWAEVILVGIFLIGKI